MSQQNQNVFDFVQASSREGSRESGPAEHHVDLFHRVNPDLMRDSTALTRKSSPLSMNKLGQARSLLTSSLRRNSPGPGSRASSPPSVGSPLIPGFYRESEKKDKCCGLCFPLPSSVCSLALSQHSNLAALSLRKQMQELDQITK